MAYEYVNGSWVWVGPGVEPIIGETKLAYEARAAVTPVAVPVRYNGLGVLPAVPTPQVMNGLAPAPVAPGTEIAVPWAAIGAGVLGWLWGQFFDENGNGNGNGLYPQRGPGPKGEAFADWGGVGKHGREGVIASNRTTTGTGWIDAETFRAWDPILQRYYQLENGSEYSDISFAPGKMAPGGNMIVKSWVTHAWRKDNSLASTQMARLANGRMMSLSEDGVMKSWRPVKNIVMARGKTTLSQAVTAQRYLDKMWRKVAKKTKQLKMA